jgi:hypothetical protein
VRANAKRGLELRKEHNRGGTEVGVARARDLSNGAALSLDTIKRMNSYFARHEVDKKGEGWGVDSAGYIAWLLWGGDAGWSWVKGILRENESKEKSTVNDLTTSYFSIEKADKQPDGTLMVYGKATDDSIDIDQQICDAAWLDRAMPAWFKSGGNIREQHSSIAAGVAKEYEVKADGHYIMAHVVDPVSVKKVDAGVLRGFSIGIKSPRVVRDQKAANGRIIDGQIVEVSLVDRPANPNCQLVLAKSVEGESSLIQVEEYIVKEKEEPNYESINQGGEGYEPSNTELYNRVKNEAKDKFDVYPSAVANAWVVREYKKRGGTYKKEPKKDKTSDLEKHGSHAQSSHGRRGAGGGAGGGGASTESKPEGPKTPKKVVNAAITSAEDRVDSAYRDIVTSAGPKPTANPRVMDAAQMREDAFNRTTDARDYIAQGNESAAASSLRSAADSLKDEPKFNPARQGLRDLADQVEKGFRKVKTKATDAELRKALQSALQSLSLNKSEENPMQDTLVELPTEAVGDLLKFDKIQYEAAREALANLIAVEAKEMREGHNELQSIAHLLEAVAHLHAWYEGEEAEGEVMEEVIEMSSKSEMKELKPMKGESEKEYKARCKEAGMDDETIKAMCDKYMGAVDSPDMAKCLECGCNQPGSDHGLKTTNDFANIAMPSNVSTAEMYAPGETPKSAEADEAASEEAPTEESAVEETPAEATVEEAATEDSEAPTEVDASDVEAIVEQVVKSATESLRAEIASLVSAKEAALEKSVGLESELAIAKSLAVAGGPSRTAKPLSTKINDNLTKAAIYKAKANATTDPVLAKGYKQLAEEFYSKASDSDNN